MKEFLAVTATFAAGLMITAALAVALENHQLADSPVDQNDDVRPRFVAVTASGYAAKLAPPTPIEFGPDAGSRADGI